MEMEIVWMILIGLAVGTIAKFILPEDNPGGITKTILLGIAGSLFATYVGQNMGWYARGESAGFLGAVAGALSLLMIFRIVGKITG